MSEMTLSLPLTWWISASYFDNSNENLKSIPALSLHILKLRMDLASVKMIIFFAKRKKKSMVRKVYNNASTSFRNAPYLHSVLLKVREMQLMSNSDPSSSF